MALPSPLLELASVLGQVGVAVVEVRARWEGLVEVEALVGELVAAVLVAVVAVWARALLEQVEAVGVAAVEQVEEALPVLGVEGLVAVQAEVQGQERAEVLVGELVEGQEREVEADLLPSEQRHRSPGLRSGPALARLLLQRSGSSLRPLQVRALL